MHELFALMTGLYWAAVIYYSLAYVFETCGAFFGKEKAEKTAGTIVRTGFLFQATGLF